MWISQAFSSKAVVMGAELLALVLFLTPGEDGADQALTEPAFLNFDIALLGEPTFGDLQVTQTLLGCRSGPCHTSDLRSFISPIQLG